MLRAGTSGNNGEGEGPPCFLLSLRRPTPDLTGNDELVCMFIVLDRNTDEIALTLGVSRNTVNATRYRLRKKLGLEKDKRLGRLEEVGSLKPSHIAKTTCPLFILKGYTGYMP